MSSPASATGRNDAIATIPIYIDTHDQSIFGSGSRRGRSWSECTFELTDYDPSLPLHLFTTLSLRNKDSKVARPLQDEAPTKNFAFEPLLRRNQTRLRRQSGLILRPRLKLEGYMVPPRASYSKDRMRELERSGHKQEIGDRKEGDAGPGV